MNDSAKRLVRSLLPRTVRPRRIRAGPLRGAWLVTSWHDFPAALLGRTEGPLLDWFAAHVRPGDTWIDVGAHYGYTTFALARLVGAAGRVFTFEPVAATAGCIDQGRVLNGLTQVTVLSLGLGAPQTIDIRRLALRRGMAEAAASDSAGAFADVPIARFDWLWPLVHGGNGTIHGIKIDVQGMEIEALDGMRAALRRWRPRLVVELHAGVSRERVLRLLREEGYSADAAPIDAAHSGAAARLLDDCSYAFEPA